MTNKFILLVCFFISITVASSQSPLQLNRDLPSGWYANGLVDCMAKLPDGKILLGGRFSVFNDRYAPGLVKLNADFSVDTTFNIGEGTLSDISIYFGTVYCITVLDDGRIMIGGSFNKFNGWSTNKVARLLANGTTDTTFKVATGPYMPPYDASKVMQILVQSDGKYVVAGNFETWDGFTRGCITRLNQNGTMDMSFESNEGAQTDFGFSGASIYALLEQPDGKIIIGGLFTEYNGVNNERIARINANGSLDLSFDAGVAGYLQYGVLDLEFDHNGDILVSGEFNKWNNVYCNQIIKLDSLGNQIPFIVEDELYASAIRKIEVLADGKIIACGSISPGNIRKYESDGSYDTTFILNYTKNLNGILQTLLPLNDSTICIGGLVYAINYFPNSYFGVLNSNGSERIITDEAQILIGESDQKVYHFDKVNQNLYAAGSNTYYNGLMRNSTAKMNTLGQLDTNFSSGAGFGGNYDIFDVEYLNNGKLMYAGYFSSYNLIETDKIIRVFPNGSLDTSFMPTPGVSGGSDKVYNLTIIDENNILVTGKIATYNDVTINNIVSIDSTGEIVPIFDAGTGTDGEIVFAEKTLDGKILLYGHFTSYNGVPNSGFIRIYPNGTLDESFNSGTGFDYCTLKVVKQLFDGRILIGGTFTTYNSEPHAGFVRLNYDGSIDTTFEAGSGFAESDIFYPYTPTINDFLLFPDSSMLIVGLFDTYNGTTTNSIIKLFENGSVNFDVVPSPGSLKIDDHPINRIFKLNDGKYLIAGEFKDYDHVTRNGLALLNGSPDDCDYEVTVVDTVICGGFPAYLPDSVLINIEGLYGYHLFGIDGCDSLVSYYAHSAPEYNFETHDTICDNESFILPDGTLADTAGIYYTTLSTVMGCDSLFTTYLNVLPTYIDTLNISIEVGEYYILPDGDSTDIPGTYISSITTTTGCDSVLVINLSTYVNIESLASTDYRIFPNPNTGLFNLQVNTTSNITTLSIVNLLGETILIFDMSSSFQNNYLLNASEIPSGMYLLKIEKQNNSILLPIIIQH